MITVLISTLLLSMFISLFFILVFKRLFYKIKVIDNPKKYWKNREPIPYSMWIVIFLSFLVAGFFTVDYNNLVLLEKYNLILIFWALITWVSFIDDLLNVSPKIRLLIQIIIWLIIWITSIKVDYISNVFWGVIDLKTYFVTIFWLQIYLIPIFFTIIWYVFVFNALNWTDWIQWNTSWLSIISFFIIFLLWLKLYYSDFDQLKKDNSIFIISITVTLIWILIPFWYFDIKEKILMWDSWTMFLWFILATLAIISGWKIATVLVVFGIYSVDAIYVLLNRIYNWKNPLKWDYSHLHHRLLKIWLTNKQVLTLVYILSFFFWFTALFLDKTWKIVVFIIIIVVVVFINKILENIKIVKNKK
jgi:UDP-GlcNAc:undecaprenyl-phosphate GlcNAc-1-phosphate transferase